MFKTTKTIKNQLGLDEEEAIHGVATAETEAPQWEKYLK